MTPIDFHQNVQDNEFEALLSDTLEARRNAVPEGLEQRLMARLAQAAEEFPTARPTQFAHFGVLRDGANSKGAFLTSIFTNLIIASLVIIVSSAVHNRIVATNTKLTELHIPLKDSPKPPPPPKLPTPKPLPEVPKFATPVLKTPPPVELPPDVKPVNVPMPKVNLAPPAPLKVEPSPAPRVVSLSNPTAAAVPNRDSRPSAVKLGAPDSPLKPNMTGPAASRVNLGVGMASMPASNAGNGANAKAVTLGNGAPSGTNLNGRAAAATPIKGLATGVLGATGAGMNGAVRIEIPPPAAKPVVAPAATVAARQPLPPVVTYTPKPIYSAEAKAMHLEGEARINVRFLANGSIQVLGLAKGLGHGLDQAALDAARGIQFRPATDPDGHAVDFQTTVVVHFLMN